jgi:hypothetical protein
MSLQLLRKPFVALPALHFGGDDLTYEGLAEKRNGNSMIHSATRHKSFSLSVYRINQSARVTPKCAFALPRPTRFEWRGSRFAMALSQGA